MPLVANEYWLQAVLIPFLIYSLAALGLNLLTGYAGQVSLGTGGFMAVGAYAAFKITTSFPGLNIVVAFLLAGLAAALVGVAVRASRRLRIKGFYLAVATLAAQFFLIWLFNKVAWFTNYASSGTITAPPRRMLGVMVTGPEATAPVRYLVALGFVALFALVAKNLVRGRVGRVLDGHPRPGHRGRDHRGAAAADQAARLRDQLVLSAAWRGRSTSSSTWAAPRPWPSTSTCRSWSCSWSSSAGSGRSWARSSAPPSS